MELLKIDDALERGFYEQQARAERWSVPELERQKAASLFLRLAVSQDKAGILQLARQGPVVEQPADLLREPYVFEFLKSRSRIRSRRHNSGRRKFETSASCVDWSVKSVRVAAQFPQ